MDKTSWIGFDLDGTVAEQDEYTGPNHIGKPLGPSIDRIKELLSIGRKVKIFTARVNSQLPPEERQQAEELIKAWCKENIGTELEVTSEKDFYLLEMFDDRAFTVEYNTGKIVNNLEI